MTSPAHEGLRVLVVEDEFLIAEEMVAVLEDAGHVVLGPAASVRAAEAVLAEAPGPDVAVIDANLRGETSAQLATNLRLRRIPVLRLHRLPPRRPQGPVRRYRNDPEAHRPGAIAADRRGAGTAWFRLAR